MQTFVSALFLKTSLGIKGLLKKVASSVLAIFPYSRIASTLRAKKWLWPCWTNPSAGSGHAFLNRPEVSDIPAVPGRFHFLISSLFNTPINGFGGFCRNPPR